MRFGQKIHPLNFDYGSDLSVAADCLRLTGHHCDLTVRAGSVFDGCLRLRLDNARVEDKRQYSLGVVEELRSPAALAPGGEGVFEGQGVQAAFRAGGLTLSTASGLVLETLSDGIGCNGVQLALNFDVSGFTGFYGFGERTGKLNKSGATFQYWNVDVVADHPHAYQRDDYDPAYVSIPFAILKGSRGYLGLFFDNPGMSVIDVEGAECGRLMYQALGGNTDLYVIDGPRLKDVVRRFARLTGRHEVPPLWALGYHQCRWGYENETDFLELRDHFARFDVPVSALWHDIDYMNGYRLFTWDLENFPNPTRLGESLKADGIRSVTIVDPGVKLDPGYAVYDDGVINDVFCKTEAGRDYVGRVWPGDTVFPDFSLPQVRDWWAEHLAAFLQESRIDGVWLDMNEPATGYSAEELMRFEGGSVPHDRYHNQYGLMMAMASRQALNDLDPDQRPFILTRAAWAGIQRYSAVWTGDNVSNWQHLRMSIPETLNLGLSGVAFNGPDVGGFMGHTTPELLIRWYQAGFLFPFFRNHSLRDSKTQEPWQFGQECLLRAREAIRTRYRLLPYLYNVFFEHWLTGDPVLRPLLYEYDGEELENLDEQFLVGDALLCAPILHGEGTDRVVTVRGEKRHLRYITLPRGWWYDLNRGEWLEGGCTRHYAAALEETPWFVRDGAVIPWYPGPLENSRMDLSRLELHVFSRDRPGELALYLDDRDSRAYVRGHYNTARVEARLSDGELRLTVDEEGDYPTGTVELLPVLYGRSGDWRAVVTVNGQESRRELKADTRHWLSKALPVLA